MNISYDGLWAFLARISGFFFTIFYSVQIISKLRSPYQTNTVQCKARYYGVCSYFNLTRGLSNNKGNQYDNKIDRKTERYTTMHSKGGGELKKRV